MKEKQSTLLKLKTKTGEFSYYPLSSIAEQPKLERLPYSIRILLEAALRNQNGFSVIQKDIDLLLNWKGKESKRQETAFMPGRVVLQDFTGVPAIVDLAALRSAMLRQGGDPKKINPQVNVDLVIDHSVQVDHFGSNSSLQKNMQREFERNQERYEFLKWGEQAFENFRIVPPGAGIVHQINLEYLANLVLRDKENIIYPDSTVGTDSHTTMINALGVLGWGVGGIEAEAVMLGQPIYMLIPDVVGVRLDNQLKAGTTATDLVLLITQTLRQHGVVAKFVEFFGPGLSSLGLADRATIANMAPEYGATCGYFPVDTESLTYLSQTGRSPQHIDLVREYFHAQNLMRTDQSKIPDYSELVEIDLAKVEASIAGPSRPQDRIPLRQAKQIWEASLKAPTSKRGFGLNDEKRLTANAVLKNGYEQHKAHLTHGSIVIAAITSCTNTSNPELMLCAGLLAKNAVEHGLKVKPYVKTSLAPGSRVVTDYLDNSGLSPFLEKLGFHTVGYGCTTCIGNSGPLPEPVANAVRTEDLIVASVLSGNRNFEGRISPQVKANFLASPPLVVAYALFGSIDVDPLSATLGTNSQGKEVYLKDIWPKPQEVQALIDSHVKPEIYRKRYENIGNTSKLWASIPVNKGEIYQWKEASTYIQEPDFFTNLSAKPQPITEINQARCLVKVGDSVTTDHISPAGAIPEDMPAGQFLLGEGVPKQEFNSFGSRRGNDRVMTRGTFGNIRLRNQMAPGTEGGWTKHQPNNQQMTIYEASLLYKQEGVPLIVLAGEEYGTGSSRDWAAKGTYTLGCRAVIAKSFERIHRSNLVGMGVLPLQFMPDQSHESIGLSGKELFSIHGLDDNIQPGVALEVKADEKTFSVLCRLDTPVEIEYYRNGGILHTVLRKFLLTSEK